MPNYLTYNTGIELICLIVALFSLTKDKSWAWRSVIFYLLIVCIVEFSGIYVKEVLRERNSWLYNILFVFEIAFFSLMFQNLLAKYFNSKPLIYTGLAILLLSYSIELGTQGIFKRTHITLIIQGVVFVTYSLIYFYGLIKDERYIDLKYSAEFWWVAAVLVCYFALTSLNVFYKELSKVLAKPNEAFRFIIIASNFFLYALWAYSFICRKWLTTKSKI
ncbi:hypothetical protein [Pedobacter sp. Hv1]|uniref:hypothetical protein n=1 Tax=Pedobacter sp. Hv1 TaxID=1740090 RepID=UPI0006D8CF82|nr:hypothetical protein [Pedobacter sp. Hv1]KQC00004.1 hypothetical protein AQF98_15980 [Pedobacter sp. Hv1]